jgi:hypothetical protein
MYSISEYQRAATVQAGLDAGDGGFDSDTSRKAGHAQRGHVPGPGSLVFRAQCFQVSGLESLGSSP